MISQMIHLLFLVYTLLIATRIIASWFPSTSRSSWLLFIAKFTDPYLNVFRKLIPPIGGVLDLSPLLAFFTLQLLERVTVGVLA